MKFNLKELILRMSYEEKRRILLQDVAQEAGVSLTTISRIANSKGDYNTTTDNVAKLCRYFKCTPNDLMTIVPDPVTGEGEAGESASSS